MNGTNISAAQRRVHVSSEALAVLVVAPFLLYAATRERQLTPVEKGLLVTAAIGTFVVDGWLLSRYAQSAQAAGNSHSRRAP